MIYSGVSVMFNVMAASPCAGSEPSVLGKLITRYADLVGQDKFWLDLVDAQVFAAMTERSLSVVDTSSSYEPKPVKETWGSFLPKGDLPGLATFVDRTKGWCLLSCNARFDPEGPRNHWRPGIFKEQCEDSAQYEQLMEAERNLCAQKQHDIRKRLVELTCSMDEDSNMNSVEMQHRQCLMDNLQDDKKWRLGYVYICLLVFVNC